LNKNTRRAPELKFEGKRPMVQPATVGSNVLGIRAKSRDKECLLTTLQIVPIFLLKIMSFINSDKIWAIKRIPT